MAGLLQLKFLYLKSLKGFVSKTLCTEFIADCNQSPSESRFNSLCKEILEDVVTLYTKSASSQFFVQHLATIENLCGTI